MICARRWTPPEVNAGNPLEQWLARLEKLHPKEMDLGLDRVRTVWQRLGAPLPGRRVVTVAGTNGKGSVVAALDAVLRAHGLAVGVTTSPHLHRFNERIAIGGVEARDEAIVAAFERIDRARADISLTYFEFAILAAIELLAGADLDVAVLEVGLGGRLDAVNIIDADIAVISSVDLDHEAWLGPDRDAIGFEKAGILRPGRPVVIGDPDVPHTVLARAAELNAPVHLIGRDFDWIEGRSGAAFEGGVDRALALAPMPPLRLLSSNVACALQASALLLLELDPTRVHDALAGLELPGRMQRRQQGGVDWLLDVAHNPHAVRALLGHLDADQRWLAVFGAFADKRVETMASLLGERVERLFLVPTQGSRGLGADELAERIAGTGLTAPVHCFASTEAALAAASEEAGRSNLRVVVAGSFTVVAVAAAWLEDGARQDLESA